jgi:hypothetical protein
MITGCIPCYMRTCWVVLSPAHETWLLPAFRFGLSKKWQTLRVGMVVMVVVMMIMIIYHDDDDCDDAYDVIMNLILFALAFCADSSIASIMTASKERVAMCPGVGSKKVQRLFDAFNQPFLVRKKPKGDEADGGAGGESSVGAAQRARGQEEEEEEGDDEMV